MGTVNSYSGSGTKAAHDLRDDLTDWLDRLPNAPPPERPDEDRPDQERPRLSPDTLLSGVQLLRPRSSRGGGGDGPGGGGGGGTGGTGKGSRSGGGASRSVAASAGSAGRAAAAAYAFRTGDAAELERLGLNYDELAALGSPTEVARRIVDAACGPRTDSTIVDHEQRLVAADIAEWVISEQEGGYVPTPEEITRRTIATIVAEAVLVETGESVDQHDQGELAESEVRDAAEALAERATLSITGATEDEFTKAIESGIETLRKIKGAKS
jgi:hypothetical protein